jgi:hypothetical protein
VRRPGLPECRRQPLGLVAQYRRHAHSECVTEDTAATVLGARTSALGHLRQRAGATPPRRTARCVTLRKRIVMIVQATSLQCNRTRWGLLGTNPPN